MEPKKLDMDLINSKPSIIICSEEALADIVPFDWSDEVLSGEKKVVME